MLGYWHRPEEEALVYRGEWFCGGDLASIDEDGYVWHHGRNDDVMNAMGYRVSPVEVEMALAEHPAVAEVAVTELRVRRDLANPLRSRGGRGRDCNRPKRSAATPPCCAFYPIAPRSTPKRFWKR